MWMKFLSLVKSQHDSEKGGPAASTTGRVEFWVKVAIRFLQFVLALTAAGLYGVRIDDCRKSGTTAPSQWVFAEVVAGLSCVTCVVYAVPKVPSFKAFAWDLLLFVFWMATFGTFASIYLHRDDSKPSDQYQGTNTSRMKHSVYVDLANMLLWFMTGVYGVFKFLKYRKQGRSMKPDLP